MAIITCGKLAKADFEKIMLVSRLECDYVITTDYLGFTDLSGTQGLKVYMEQDLDVLLHGHLERLRTCTSRSWPWEPTEGLEQMQAIDRDERQALLARRLA